MESGGDEKSLESGGGNNNNQHHTHYLFQLPLRVIVLFVTVGLLLFVLYHSAYPFQLLPSSFKISSREANFMSNEYLKMMWRRIDFLRTVLDLGYNFIFTDADIMWFRDPFPHFYPKSDFEIACDYFRGDPSNLNNRPNGGFTYVKSNTRTIHFYEFWYRSRETYPGLHDQDVLNKIKYDRYIRKNGIQIKFLDTKYFGGICEPSRDFNQVCTMHANCCVGLDNKIYDLKIMLDDWRNYMTRGDLQPSTWTVPQRCGAASFRPREPSPKNDTQGSKG